MARARAWGACSHLGPPPLRHSGPPPPGPAAFRPWPAPDVRSTALQTRRPHRSRPALCAWRRRLLPHHPTLRCGGQAFGGGTDRSAQPVRTSMRRGRHRRGLLPRGVEFLAVPAGASGVSRVLNIRALFDPCSQDHPCHSGP